MYLWSDQPSLQILWIFEQNKFDVWEFLKNVWKSYFWENLCFWKTLHLILMHFTHIFQCLEDFMQKLFFFFSKLCFFLEFRSIEAVFRSIEIVSKFFDEPLSVSINRNSWIRFFLKTEFDLFKLTFQKFFKLFFLSPT